MESKLKNRPSINIVANAIYAMSGGDRIFMEFARRWAGKGHAINVFTVEKGFKLCTSYGLNNVSYQIWSSSKVDRLGLLISYIIRTIRGCIRAGSKHIVSHASGDKNVIVYSSSDFWPDSIPAFIMHRRIKNSRWVASFYMFIM